MTADRMTVSASGLAEGVRASLVLLPGTIVFGMAFAALAAKSGFTLVETVLFSAVIYAGAAQFAAVGAWPEPLTLAGALGIVVVVATVNARFVLIGAAMRPHMAGTAPPLAYGLQAVTTDFSWITSVRYLEGGGRDLGVPLGAGLFIWLIWWGSAVPGWWFGQMMDDPRRYGVDMVLVLMFASYLVPLWKGMAGLPPWIVAGVVSLAVTPFVPAYLNVFVGALAGAIAGALREPR